MKRITNAPFAILLVTVSITSRSAIASQYEGTYLYALPEDFGSVVYFGSSGVFGGQVAGAISSIEATRATILNAPTGVPTDLHPAGFWHSEAKGTDGIRQVGFGISGDNPGHALAWTGNANSVVDLHPGDFHSSTAYDVSGEAQVGFGEVLEFSSIGHALLWRGTADSVVDLHPDILPDHASSEALATDGIHQVGYAAFRAALWSGTAASFVDLHPANGYLDSFAHDVMNGQQVGRGSVDMPFFADPNHALLWTGSAESVIDLNPTDLSPYGSIASAALGTNGFQQVGWGQPFTSAITWSMPRAVLWSGTAASAVDLHAVLPLGFEESRAFSIDIDGVVWGLARDESYRWHAVMCAPIAVPEPGAALLAIGVMAIVATTRRVCALGR